MSISSERLTCQFLELVSTVLSLITRMASINAELTKQLTHLRRRKPRSETLDRLGRQMEFGFALVKASPAKPKDKERTKGHGGGGRGTLPARLARVQTVRWHAH